MKMAFVKHESEENTSEPETWRIKHEEPEPCRIKHEEPEPCRIKHEEPEPCRIKHEEPEPCRIKHEEPEPCRIKHEEPEPCRIKHEEPEPWRIKHEETRRLDFILHPSLMSLWYIRITNRAARYWKKNSHCNILFFCDIYCDVKKKKEITR